MNLKKWSQKYPKMYSTVRSRFTVPTTKRQAVRTKDNKECSAKINLVKYVVELFTLMLFPGRWAFFWEACGLADLLERQLL